MKQWNKSAARGNRLARDKGLRGGSYGPAGPAISLMPDQKALREAHKAKRRTDHGKPRRANGIWITIGPDCPWNTTPGTRQTHHFQTIDEATNAGFKGIT